MSKHKKNKGAPNEEKKLISINPNAFTDGRDIRNVLSTGKKERSVWSSIYENLLYTIGELDFEGLERFLETNTMIPTLIVSGEPDIRVFLKGHYIIDAKGGQPKLSGEPKELFKYVHSNGGEYNLNIFGLQQPKQSKNTVHYLFGKVSNSSQMWSFRKEFEDVSIKIYDCSIPHMPLLQGYLKVEGEVKKGRVKNITTSIVNLGEQSVLEAIIDDSKKYVSGGIKRHWNAYTL